MVRQAYAAVNVERRGGSPVRGVRPGTPPAVTLNPRAAQRAERAGAIAVATELEIDDAAIQRATGFRIDRRLQALGESRWTGASRWSTLRPSPDEVAATLCRAPGPADARCCSSRIALRGRGTCRRLRTGV
jgi:hypothetical protein